MEGDLEDPDSEEQSEDVTQLLHLLKRVRADNIDLRRNFESLKGIHLQLNDDHKQLQSKYNALYEERVNVEKQYQALCESWRLELEEKQRQFDQAKSQIKGPRDLELLKAAMAEKIEAPFRTKCEILAKEAEAAQQNFVASRRRLEELQASHRSLEIRTQHEREVMVAEHTQTVSELRDQLAGLLQVQGKLGQAESRSKALERERNDLQFQLTKLREDLHSIQQAKERATVEKDSVEMRVERRVKNIQAEEAQLSGLVETLSRKNRHLQKELAEAHRSNEEMFDQRLKAQVVQTSLQSQLDSLKRQHESEQTALEAQHLQGARALEDKLLQLRDQLHDKERQMAELHISHQEQMTQMVESQSTRLEEVEKEHGRKIREVKDQCAELSAKVEVLKDALDDTRRENDNLIHKSKRDVETHQRQLEKLQTQLSEAQAQIVAKDASLSELKAQVEQLKAEIVKLELTKAALEKSQEELEARAERLNKEMAALGISKQEVIKSRDTLRDQLDKERLLSLDKADQQRQAFAAEKSAITKRYQSTIQDLVDKHDGETKKLKRRARASEAREAQLAHELTQMRLRCHELEVLVDPLPDSVAQRDVVSQLLGHASMLGPGAAATLLGTPGRSGGGLSAGAAGYAFADMSAEIAALKKRQQEYLSAAAASSGR